MALIGFAHALAACSWRQSPVVTGDDITDHEI
jgi:hypothetical protein